MKIISKTIAFIWLILSSSMLQAKSLVNSWLATYWTKALLKKRNTKP